MQRSSLESQESRKSWQKMVAYNVAVHPVSSCPNFLGGHKQIICPLGMYTSYKGKQSIMPILRAYPEQQCMLIYKMLRYGRMLCWLLRKMKGLILFFLLFLHLLLHSYNQQLFLPGNGLIRPSWENDSSALLVSDGSVVLQKGKLIEWHGRTGMEPFSL